MKTYTQEKNREPFNWNEFLNKETITDDEWSQARLLAKSWVTCACGNQCHIIPRTEDGKPIDNKLLTLGADDGFYGAIMGKNIKSAKSFLKKIEKRSTYLIKAEIEKAKQLLKEVENWDLN